MNLAADNPRLAETPRLLRRPLRLAARRETLEFWRDAVKLVQALVAEQARFLDAVRGALIDQAKRRVASGGPDLLAIPPDAFYRHARTVAQILAAAEVAGRLRTRRQAAEAAEEPSLAQFAEIVPENVPPARVVEYIRSLPAVERARWEAFVAAHQGQGFTVAGIESQSTLKALRDLVAESVEKGWSLSNFEARAGEVLDGLAKVGEARLRTVWNMTVSNALREGRYAELRDPDVAGVLTHFLFDAIIDGVVRENHAALDNGIAPVNWPGWATYGDPLGFNCRCSRIAITAGRARRMIASGEGFDLTDHVPAMAGPDPGFRRLV